MTRKYNGNRLHNYPNDHFFTQEEAADLMGCAKGTIAQHRYAGLLAFRPGSPIKIRAGDLKVYEKMMSNGHKSSLHRTMSIKAEDSPTYSRLDGMQSMTYASPNKVIQDVIQMTNKLWVNYKAAEAKG